MRPAAQPDCGADTAVSAGFEENRFGILEIPQDRADAIDGRAIDIVIVPCVAYAADGYRLGYGGGYYDRFLPQLRSGALTVGAVMDELLLDEVPVGVYDVKTKVVGTQSRCCFTGGAQWE
jgi:5-formyltetrahydrofolate cyclo-ligase